MATNDAGTRWRAVVLTLGLVALVVGGLLLRGRVDVKMIGEEVPPGTYSWTARVFKVHDYGALLPICAGTLVAPRWILTARHCRPDDGQALSVLLRDGNHYRLDTRRYPNPIDHPCGVDARLLYLEASAPDLGWVTLPTVRPADGSAEEVEAVGWGLVLFGARVPWLEHLRWLGWLGWLPLVQEKLLRSQPLHLLSSEDCERAFKNHDPAREVCSRGVGPQYGDSGGPLLRRGQALQLGVMCDIMPNRWDGTVTLNTRTSWINQWVESCRRTPPDAGCTVCQGGQVNVRCPVY